MDNAKHEAAQQDEIERERRAVKLFNDFIDENADELKLIAHWGDGHCGYMLHILQEKLSRKP
ncbi:hypothetical protein FLM52_05270 [bacterium Scap17]|nr:hypothetical protein [bacterium Scap17]